MKYSNREVMASCDFGFRGLGIGRFDGQGFRGSGVQGLRFRMWGESFGAYFSSGFRVQDLGLRA
jgi:hypothetical protein